MDYSAGAYCSPYPLFLFPVSTFYRYTSLPTFSVTFLRAGGLARGTGSEGAPGKRGSFFGELS